MDYSSAIIDDIINLKRKQRTIFVAPIKRDCHIKNER